MSKKKKAGRPIIVIVVQSERVEPEPPHVAELSARPLVEPVVTRDWFPSKDEQRRRRLRKFVERANARGDE